MELKTEIHTAAGTERGSELMANTDETLNHKPDVYHTTSVQHAAMKLRLASYDTATCCVWWVGMCSSAVTRCHRRWVSAWHAFREPRSIERGGGGACCGLLHRPNMDMLVLALAG